MGLPDTFERAHNGCSHAIGELLVGCRQYLLLVANEELAGSLSAKVGGSDIVQETFLRAQDQFGSFRGSNQSELVAWLRTILLNHLATTRRHYVAAEKRQVSREISLDDERVKSIKDDLMSNTKSPSSHAIDREKEHVLDRALDELSERYQLVVRLRHREHLSFEDIADQLELSPDAARQLWARAIKQLKTKIKTRLG